MVVDPDLREAVEERAQGLRAMTASADTYAVTLRAAHRAAHRIEQAQARILATAASTPLGLTELQAIAFAAMTAEGWGPGQWAPLNLLITRESGWNPRAKNPKSGAYGLPQSLPGIKMAAEGPDWRTNPETQLRWMMGYIRERYGDPKGAWAHSQAVGWY